MMSWASGNLRVKPRMWRGPGMREIDVVDTEVARNSSGGSYTARPGVAERLAALPFLPGASCKGVLHTDELGAVSMVDRGLVIRGQRNLFSLVSGMSVRASGGEALIEVERDAR